MQTTLPFHAWLLDLPAFRNGDLRIDLVAREWHPEELRRAAAERAIEAVARAVSGGGAAAVEAGDGQRTPPARPSAWALEGRRRATERWT